MTIRISMDRMVENECLHSIIRFIEWSNETIHFNRKLKQVADVANSISWNRRRTSFISIDNWNGGRRSFQCTIGIKVVLRSNWQLKRAGGHRSFHCLLNWNGRWTSFIVNWNKSLPSIPVVDWNRRGTSFVSIVHWNGRGTLNRTGRGTSFTVPVETKEIEGVTRLSLQKRWNL